MGANSVRTQDLSRSFRKSNPTIGRWLAPAKHKDILNALRGDRIGFSQAVALAEIDNAETRENALRDVAVPKGEKKTTLEDALRKIELLVQNSKGQIKTSPEPHTELDERKEGVSESEITDTSQEGLSEGELTELPVDDGEGTTEDALTSPETPESIIDRAFEMGGEKGVEEVEVVSPVPPQSPLPEEKVDVIPDPDPSPETKITKFVSRMQRLGEATTTHMRHKELESLDDSSYRKILKDYEEASFAIDGFRDFLQGRENNGSVQYNRAKRLHNAIREFDAHSISSVKEATDLRSIKIQTKKKLTEDVNILDTIANAKRGG